MLPPTWFRGGQFIPRQVAVLSINNNNKTEDTPGLSLNTTTANLSKFAGQADMHRSWSAHEGLCSRLQYVGTGATADT